jgi:hypothetical protein
MATLNSNSTPRIDTIARLLKRSKRGFTVAEIQAKTGWEGERVRASISSILSRMERDGEVTTAGLEPRGAGKRYATVYKYAA